MVRGRVHELRYLVEIPIPYVDRRGRAVDPRKRLMKPAPAIPKTLEAKVARVARHLRKAPRLVLKEAIDEYVARHDPEAVTDHRPV